MARMSGMTGFAALMLCVTAVFWIAAPTGTCLAADTGLFGTPEPDTSPEQTDAFDAAVDVPTGRSESAAESPLEMTVAEAVMMALDHNVAFRIERIEPDIQRQYEDVEQAVFDPHISADVAVETASGATDSDTVSAHAGVEQFLPTGTTVEAVAAVADTSADAFDERAASLDVQVTQALLRGRGRAVNLARLRQARIDTQLSRHELRAVAEALVAGVENAYWDCVLAREKIEIYTKSAEVAAQQIAEVRERVNVGKLAELELAAAEAEVAEKREELISARGDLAIRLLQLRRLVNPVEGQWSLPLQLTDEPYAPEVVLDGVEAHVTLGLRNRPDLAQARLGVRRGELDVVRTRNGQLPQLDVFVRLGGTHYAESFSSLDDDEDVRASVGLALNLPLGLRAERARHRVATLSLSQYELALENMAELIQLDVRTAYVRVGVAREQIAATAATRKLRQDTLTAEREKFRVGTSTTLQVAQAWRDLIGSEINEIEAVVSLRKALISLYRLESTLLQRRGLDISGIDLPAASP